MAGAKLNIRYLSVGSRKDSGKCKKCVVCGKALRKNYNKTGICSNCSMRERELNKRKT